MTMCKTAGSSPTKMAPSWDGDGVSYSSSENASNCGRPSLINHGTPEATLAVPSLSFCACACMLSALCLARYMWDRR
jgi:hypothetical protein